MELEGVPIEEGTVSGGNPAFLMEMMEVNEAVEESRTPEEADRIGQDTKGWDKKTKTNNACLC